MSAHLILLHRLVLAGLALAVTVTEATALASAPEPPPRSVIVSVERSGAFTTRFTGDDRAAPGLTLDVERAGLVAALPFDVIVRVRNESGRVAYHASVDVLLLDQRGANAREIPSDQFEFPGGARGLLPLQERASRLRIPPTRKHGVLEFLLRPTIAPRLVAVLGGPGKELGQFSKPRGIQPLPDGRLVVADRGNNRVQILDANGAPLKAWGGFGQEPGRFDHPEDVAVDAASGEIFVCDMNNARIQVFDTAGDLKRIIDAADHGGFNHPSDLALSPQGDSLYVADVGNFRVVHLSRAGEWRGAWGTAGEGPGQFRAILDVEVGHDGRVFVTDGANQELQVFAPTGQLVAEVNHATSPTASIRYPTAVVSVSDDMVLLADFAQDRVMALGLDGRYVGEFGRDSDAPGGLRYPSDLRLVGALLYVSETASDSVTIFDLSQWEPFAATMPKSSQPRRGPR